MILPERFQSSIPEENLYLRRPAFVREYRTGGAPPPSYSFRTCVSKARWFLWTRGQQDDIDSKILERVYSRIDLLERIFSSNLILSSFQKKKERKSFILAHHQEETTRYQATLKQRMLIKSTRVKLHDGASINRINTDTRGKRVKFPVGSPSRGKWVELWRAGTRGWRVL